MEICKCSCAQEEKMTSIPIWGHSALGQILHAKATASPETSPVRKPHDIKPRKTAYFLASTSPICTCQKTSVSGRVVNFQEAETSAKSRACVSLTGNNLTKGGVTPS